MSHIAFELDALPLVPKVARSAGIQEAVVGWGLTQMWEWCWREKTDRVTTNHLRGFFGAELGAVLVDFGFLEAVGSSLWRVRGAARYLRIQEGRAKGGKAAVANGNLKRGKTRQLAPPSQLAPSTFPAGSQHTSQLDSRLSATSDERLATSDKRSTTSLSPADVFWGWAQDLRERAGCIREKPPEPRTLSGWYSAALLELSGDDGRLREAWLCFGDDPFWQKATPACPFRAFMNAETGWRKYVPRRAS